MAGTPESERPQTLAEMLMYLSDPERRREFERYRIDYEAAHGETDLTKRYTSTWPPNQQEWLMKHDIRRYFDGLPPFAKAYLKGKMQLAAREGKLDDMPENMLRLFVSKNMRLDTDRAKW